MGPKCHCKEIQEFNKEPVFQENMRLSFLETLASIQMSSIAKTIIVASSILQRYQFLLFVILVSSTAQHEYQLIQR